VMGVFLGPMLACMVLAMTKFTFTTRAMLCGMIGGTAVGTWVAFSPVSGMWVSPLAFLVAVLIPISAAPRRRPAV